MVQNLNLIPFILLKEYFIKLVVVKHYNKMGELSTNTNIFTNIGRALLFQSHLPQIFWSYAVLYVMFLINRVPSPSLRHLSPFELLYNKTPDYEDFKPFECLSYTSTLKQGLHKFDPRASQCVLLGYKLGVKGCIFYDIATGEINVTQNVIFFELVFPFQACQRPIFD